jgi:hypothetical protein
MVSYERYIREVGLGLWSERIEGNHRAYLTRLEPGKALYV